MGNAWGKAEALKEAAPTQQPAVPQDLHSQLPPLIGSGFPEGRDQPHSTLDPHACHRGKATLKHKFLVLAIQ